MKNFKIVMLTLCFYCCIPTIYSQFSIKPDLSLGVNYATMHRRHLKAPSVETLLPTHSYSANVNIQFTFADSSYTLATGIGFLKRPITYILADEDLSTYTAACDLSSMTFGYDSFRRKQNYYFIEFPLYLMRNLNCGLGFYGGLNFKLHQAGLLKADRIFERYSYKFFNWGLLLGMNYKINSKLSVSLKTDLEYMPFVTEDFFGTITVVSNFNTMLSIGYTFELK